MSRYRNSYGGYRGRNTLHDVLKVIAILLAICVVLVVAGLFFGQRYLVFTDGGVRVNWPWSPGESSGSAGSSLDPGDISVDPGSASASQDPSASGSASSEQPAAPESARVAALQLPISSVADGTAGQLLSSYGANALILEMKDQEGKLGWVSGQEAASRARVNADNASINDTLRTWCQGDTYTIARLCCFRDNSVPYYINTMATRVKGGNWRDELKLRWMSPDSEAARTYIVGLCSELAEMGFDEIVLENCNFPYAGNLNRITKSDSYKNGTYNQTVEALIDQIKAAIAPYGTKIAIRVTRGFITGEVVNSGITNGLLESRMDRIWIERDGLTPEIAEQVATAGITDVSTRLVEIVPALETDATGGQASLSVPEAG